MRSCFKKGLSFSNSNIPPPTKILIIANKLVGDVMATLPTLHALQRKWPRAKFFVLGGSYTNELYECFGLSISFLDLNITRHYTDANWSLKFFLKKLQLIKSHCFDMGIAFPGGIEHALILKLAKIPLRLGSKTDARSFLLTHSYPMSRQKPNYQVFENVLEILNIDTLPPPIFTPKANALAKLKKNLKNHFINSSFYYIVSPKASQSHKEWPNQYFEQLILDLKRHFPHLNAVLLGTAAEKDALQLLAKKTSSLSLAGRTSFFEACSLINEAKFFLGNDSGLAHVAGGLNQKTFILYGPTNYLLTRPWGKALVPIIAGGGHDIPPEERTKRRHKNLFKIDNILPQDVLETILKEMENKDK